MRRLTAHERMALQEIGAPDEGPVPDAVFCELVELGWGYWTPDPESPRDGLWCVTAKGRAALRLDTIARAAG